MKRPLLATLIIGIFVVIVVSALHLSGRLLHFESAVAEYISSYRAATHVVPKWQYVFMAILAFGVAWLTVTSSRRGWMGLVAMVLLIELVGVCVDLFALSRFFSTVAFDVRGVARLRCR